MSTFFVKKKKVVIMPACTRIDDLNKIKKLKKAIRKNVPVSKLTFYHAVK